MNTTTELRVLSIVCGGRAGGIKKALDKVSGINRVEVDVNIKVVSVEHDEQISRERKRDWLTF